jgi:hypothetical protein
VVLVALGLWTEGSGKRQILDWEIADSEENEKVTMISILDSDAPPFRLPCL